MPKRDNSPPPQSFQNQLALFSASPKIRKSPSKSMASSKSMNEPPKRPKSKRLDQAVKAHLGTNTLVKVTDTNTVLLSSSLNKGRVKARVHQMFLDANDDEMNAVGLFLKNGDKGAGEIIDAFVERQRHLLGTAPKEGSGAGQFHHLEPIFNVLKKRYFPDISMPVDIVWGRYSRAKSKRSITLGTFDSRANRITIHPALDQEHVPRTCVARVVHHEMCHFVHPAQLTTKGKRRVHTPAFRAEEAKYDDANFADLWINKNLSALLLFDGNNNDSDE